MLKPLTSFRFIAAAGVVLAHFGYPSKTGGLAVGFFFTLSGFILAYNYADKFHTLKASDVAKFWALRVARIWPLHVVMFLAVLPLVWMRGTQYTDWQAFANLSLLHAWYPDGENIFSYNGVSWSISDELFFYMALPFLLVGLHKLGISRSVWKAALALVVTFGVMFLIALVLRTQIKVFNTSWWLMMVSPYVRILDFIIGVCLGLIFLRLQNARRTVLDLPLFTLLEVGSLALLAVLYVSTWHKWPTLENSAYYQPAMVAIILVFAFQRGALSALLSNKVMTHLGEISFALYMVHQPILFYADRLIGPTIMVAKDLDHIWGQVLLTVLMLALSDCAYRYIEVPARNAVRAMVSSRRTAVDAGFSARGAHE